LLVNATPQTENWLARWSMGTGPLVKQNVEKNR
jgi:hypothetical protein